jgi:hypothetical protein
VGERLGVQRLPMRPPSRRMKVHDRDEARVVAPFDRG